MSQPGTEPDPAALPALLTAQTPAQARLLLDLRYAAVLGVVMAQASSAGEVAGQTELNVKQAHHCLTRLLEVGLVRVCAVQKRGGRAIKLYRAVAASFSVPFALTDAEGISELMAEMYRPFFGAVVRQQAKVISHPQQVFIHLNANHQVAYDYGSLAGFPGRHMAYGTFGTAHLLPEDALYLQQELKRLRAWADERHNEDQGESYLLGLMFTSGKLEP